MHRNRLSEETITKILNMYDGGISKNLICERLDVGIRTIRNIISKSKARICLEKFGKIRIIEQIKPKDLNTEIPIRV